MIMSVSLSCTVTKQSRLQKEVWHLQKKYIIHQWFAFWKSLWILREKYPPPLKSHLIDYIFRVPLQCDLWEKLTCNPTKVGWEFAMRPTKNLLCRVRNLWGLIEIKIFNFFSASIKKVSSIFDLSKLSAVKYWGIIHICIVLKILLWFDPLKTWKSCRFMVSQETAMHCDKTRSRSIVYLLSSWMSCLTTLYIRKNLMKDRSTIRETYLPNWIFYCSTSVVQAL